MRFYQSLPVLLLLLLPLLVPAQTAPPKGKDQTNGSKTGTVQGGTLRWQFPVRRTHAGALMGNGTQGLMVWGGDRTLNVTVGRAGFWDHRGGNEFSTRTKFGEVKKLLQAKDEESIKKVFELPKTGDQGLGHPQQLGGGRLELTLPEGWQLQRADLHLGTATLQVLATAPGGQAATLTVNQSVTEELAWIDLPAPLAGKVGVKLIPSWEFVKEALQKVGVAAPAAWTETAEAGTKVSGFTQTLPADDPLAMGFAVRKDRVIVGSALGKTAAQDVAKAVGAADPTKLRAAANDWWKTYWSDVPRIQLPDPALQEIVDYGLYKQACATPPQGVACALQGPFMEEYQLPPWSNDYHFNINIQMIYWPALATNRLSHFGPLWNLIKGWMPQLKRNGEQFFGREGALMLPHAVDDRCRVVGTFWAGTIDHACTAWMAQMAWQHYRYGMDPQVLQEVAWPLLVGAFEGYWAMLEEVDDGKGGKRLSLPVSVSPEYRGSGMNAVGRDASFQLAALHRVARTLPEAAKLLGKPADARWEEVRRRLPPYTTFEGTWLDEWNQSNKRIALWEGMDLIESHRHHSHLGAIYPFATISNRDPEHKDIVKNSLTVWKYRGAGGWSGWCVPWASILWARSGQTEAAVSWLHWWKENFTNEGRGTLHNAANNGTSALGSEVLARMPADFPNYEIMQLDAGFGALNAVLELLVQHRDDAIYVLPDRHRDWRDVQFDNIRTEGAFLLSARVAGGQAREVRVKSLVGGPLRLAHGLGEKYLLNGQPADGAILDRECKAGEELVLKQR